MGADNRRISTRDYGGNGSYSGLPNPKKNRPEVVIISPYRGLNGHLEHLISQSPYLQHSTTCESVNHYRNIQTAFSNPIFFVTADQINLNGGEKSTPELVRAIKRHSGGKVVMIYPSGLKKIPSEELISYVNLGAKIMTGDEIMSEETSSYEEHPFHLAMQDWVNAGELKQKLNIGVAGNGRLGRALVLELMRLDSVANITWYSEHKRKLLPASMGFIPGASKVNEAHSLEELFNKGKDIMMIARGRLGGFNRPRDEVIRDAFIDTVQKTLPILEAARDTQYGGILMPFGNPPGVYQYLAHYEYQLRSNLLTSIANDAPRGRKLYCEDLAKSGENSLLAKICPEDLFFLDAIGEHGSGIALVNLAKVAGDYEVFLKSFPHLMVEDRTRRTIEVSSKIMQSCDDLKIPPLDTARQVAMGIDALAHFQQPPLCWYREINASELKKLKIPSNSSVYPLTSAFLMAPTHINYGYQPKEPSMSIEPNPRIAIHKILDSAGKKRFIQAIEQQRRYVEEARQIMREKDENQRRSRVGGPITSPICAP